MLRTVSGPAPGTTDAHRETAMTRIPALLGILALGACYAEAAPAVQYTTPEPTMVAGPPGGAMDRPAYAGQYQDPNMYSQAPVDPNAGGAPGQPYNDQDPNAPVDPYSQQAAPMDPNATMGSVDDNEINQTLAPYGSWQEVDGYGRVWRPNATVVGVDFTPYETAGSWVYTDYGWTYSCDWGWGWLPFHYGYWDWFDGYWGWIPGYTWGPAWVDWRYGNGYVGWRPSRPPVRDHRHHGGEHPSHWRFTAANDLGKAHIKSHLFNNPAEGLRATTPTTHPPLRGNPVHASAVMQGRLTSPAFHTSRSIGSRGNPRVDAYGHPAVGVNRPAYRQNEQPTWQNNRTWRQPSQPPQWRQPSQQWRQPNAPTGQWRQPTAPAGQWRQPSQTYRPPTYSPPARTYTPPTRTYSPPTHSAPSHSA